MNWNRIGTLSARPAEIVSTWLMMLKGSGVRIGSAKIHAPGVDSDYERGRVEALASLLPVFFYLLPMFWYVGYVDALPIVVQILLSVGMIPLAIALLASLIWYRPEIEQSGVVV